MWKIDNAADDRRIGEISDGELLIDGKMMNQVQSCDRDIAMVFQNYALYPHMTVFENMAYSLRLKKVPKKNADRRWRKRQRFLDSKGFWTESRENFRAGRSREWQWDVPLYGIQEFS